jgi:bifunctional DNA-binding transcriptional regulator/antitoxin component of YhaV-PrlF toxin-antitoxin module
MEHSITTRIAGKFLVAVPQEIRAIYDLCEGDLFEWLIDSETAAIRLVPKRAQLLAPQVSAKAAKIRETKRKILEEETEGKLLKEKLSSQQETQEMNK